MFLTFHLKINNKLKIYIMQNSTAKNAELLEEQEKTEGRIQSECFQWFKNSFPHLRGLMYHVPNGGKKSKKEAGQLFAMGVVPGVPDLEFHFWKRTFFLECKTPIGTVSPDQKNIHTILHEHGFRVFVFRSLEQFQNIIYAILEDKSPMFQRGLKREAFEYRTGVFNYLYDLPEGTVQIINEIVSPENMEKFKGLVMEFICDGYDKLEGFELLFTPDLLGFYKKDLEQPSAVFYNGTNEITLK